MKEVNILGTTYTIWFDVPDEEMPEIKEDAKLLKVIEGEEIERMEDKTLKYIAMNIETSSAGIEALITSLMED